MVPSRRLPLVLLAVIPLTACARPELAGFDLPEGTWPRALVVVRGTDLSRSRIIWDAGTRDERVLPGAFLGAGFFSIPPGASQRAHAVALEGPNGRSPSVSLTVKGATAFPRPRIDYVTLLGALFDTPRKVKATLYVQGANFDIGAIVAINGNDVATTTDKTLLNDWHGVPVSELDYPIYRYVSTIAIAGERMAGSPINVTVRNLDGTVSPVFKYKLPTSAADMDSDGDRLLDSWETAGYDANGDGIVDVDLPALGADPKRRDLFVEIDVMDNVMHPPAPETFAAAQAMFKAAPIINPLTTNGINLVLDVSGKPCLPAATGGPVCSFQKISFDAGHPLPIPPNPTAFVRFSSLKANNFDNAKRGRIYHYGIWGIDMNIDASGESDFADDFVVAFDGYPSTYQTVRSQVEELVHEIGHDLRQLHGGDSHQPKYKPNYLSVMSYNWALRTGWPQNTDRQSRVTCLPFYYAATGADEAGGAVYMPLNTVVDYSEGMAKTLVRPPKKSAAPPTLCGKVVQFDALGAGVSTSRDFANWPALAFDGPVLNGWPMPSDGIRP